MTVMELSRVSKEFHERTILQRVDFQLQSGEIVALTGANGSGKSTLLRIMAGLSKPTEGQVLLFDQEPGAKTRKRTGILLDEAFLYGDLTAEENLLYYAKLYRIPNRRQVVDTSLRLVGLNRDARQLVKTFSKGMRQRLGIVRAALHAPDLMLLDEPFDGLDSTHAERILELVKQWREEGRAIVLISHDERVIQTLATRVVRVTRGFLRTVQMINESAQSS